LIYDKKVFHAYPGTRKKYMFRQAFKKAYVKVAGEDIVFKKTVE